MALAPTACTFRLAGTGRRANTLSRDGRVRSRLVHDRQRLEGKADLRHYLHVAQVPSGQFADPFEPVRQRVLVDEQFSRSLCQPPVVAIEDAK